MTTSPERRYTDRLEEFADRHPFLVDLALIAVLMGSATLGASLTLPNAQTPGDDKAAVLLLGSPASPCSCTAPTPGSPSW